EAGVQQAKPAQEKPQAAVVNEQPANSEEQPASANAVNYDHEIVSPMVGTFYAASSPENDPFVTRGSSVETNTVVCIVEAMKLFNEIEAEISGEIVEVLVENGELVEYGQPLFRVKK
ncbi:acetyl-CoA carboxylase biotin carboxyl carrier protein, partial [Oceanobacillus profundus]|uniref:acetyl-CoA carboxylase biotin carboxyl carrier protein n=2 Tax=Oceanobacillus TaxID=182709 RepID=UPI0026E3F256